MNIRKVFERGFAGLTFGGSVVLVYVGTLAVCFRDSGLIA
jgi:hypothetical protein